jgi:hypothetical protein
MVDRAHRDPVWQDRLAALNILPNVSRIQQFGVPQVAESAGRPICREDPLAEERLMEPLPHDPQYVPASQGARIGRDAIDLA